MRNTILSLLGASLIAAFSAQAAAASGHHRVPAMSRNHATASEQFRSSNAYFAPRNIAVPSDGQVYDGAMGSGIAGH
jgi:streptogramin lyase